MTEKPFAFKVAQFAAAVDRAPLSSAVLEAVKLRLLDTVGCVLGAANAEPVRIAREVAQQYGKAPGHGPNASIVGARGCFALESAAFVNGVAGRYLDFNDIYLSREAVHPSDNIPHALALAQALERDGMALLRAILVGYEVHCRLADTVSTRSGGWDSVILGAIAASAMAGSLLGLSVEQRAQAIALAACSNVALMESRVGALSMWKAAAAAYAGKGGLFAALHAAHGLTGPPGALDGTYGLFARVTGVSDSTAFTPGDDAYRIQKVHLKAYPAQYFTQTAISAASSLRQEIAGTAIVSIRIGTFEFGRVAAADTPDKWRPRTRETADHSLPYCVAVMLLDGVVSEAQFEPSRVLRDDVQALMQKVEVVEDSNLNPLYPERVPSRIRIELEDGRTLQAACDFPLGHTKNPMLPAEVLAKFEQLAVFGGGGAAMKDGLLQVEMLDGQEIVELLARLGDQGRNQA